MEKFIIILLFSVTVCFMFIIIRSVKKIIKYEKLIIDNNENYVKVINNIVDWIKIALSRLHDIDRKQIFEADDDVGWFFKTLKFQITELNNQIARILEFNVEEKTEEKK